MQVTILHHEREIKPPCAVFQHDDRWRVGLAQSAAQRSLPGIHQVQFSLGRSAGVSRPMSEYWNAPSIAHDTTSPISRFDTPESRRVRDKTSFRNWLNSATQA